MQGSAEGKKKALEVEKSSATPEKAE